MLAIGGQKPKYAHRHVIAWFIASLWLGYSVYMLWHLNDLNNWNNTICKSTSTS